MFPRKDSDKQLCKQNLFLIPNFENENNMQTENHSKTGPINSI